VTWIEPHPTPMRSCGSFATPSVPARDRAGRAARSRARTTCRPPARRLSSQDKFSCQKTPPRGEARIGTAERPAAGPFRPVDGWTQVH
jgi:hypothetical protein